MGIGYNTSIVRDGLVLHLDAANVKSYPGSGTTWTDLSGQGNNGTLVNGVGYSSDNNGSLTFDGVNDNSTIDNFSSDSSSAITVTAWVYATSLTNSTSNGNYLNWIINKRPTTSPNSSSWQMLTINSFPIFAMWDANNNLITSSGPDMEANSTTAMSINQWYCVTTTTSGVSGDNLYVYLNDKLNLTDTLSGNRGIATKQLKIGSTGWQNGYNWDGKISNITIHNRELSAAEVRQNFNALRGRYGI